MLPCAHPVVGPRAHLRRSSLLRNAAGTRCRPFCAVLNGKAAHTQQQQQQRTLAEHAAGTEHRTVKALLATHLMSAALALTPLAASAAEAVEEAADAAQKSEGLLAPISDGLESILKLLQTGLDTVHVPYSFGWSIILLTLLVKLATYPFLKKQVESSMSVQALKPRIDRIKARYGEDKAKVQRETQILYEEAGVDPLAGCLPSLATIPIFIGLYGSLTNVANEGLLDSQGFYWISSLSGPTSMAARQAGAGTAWLFPIVDGAPPIGWDAAIPYLVLPVLLLAAQYISTSIISPPVDPNDENAKTTKIIVGFLPLMIGWFSLNVPSGLSLYYFANTVLSTVAQVYLRKFGGASVVIKDLGPVTKLGSGRRLGEVAAEEPWAWSGAGASAEAGAEGDASAAVAAAGEAEGLAAAGTVMPTDMRSKRRRPVKKRPPPPPLPDAGAASGELPGISPEAA